MNTNKEIVRKTIVCANKERLNANSANIEVKILIIQKRKVRLQLSSNLEFSFNAENLISCLFSLINIFII